MSENLKNMYLMVPLPTMTEVEAIKRGFEICKHLDVRSVEVRICGTQRQVARIFPSGSVVVEPGKEDA